CFIFSMLSRSLRFTLFPYTTLFRSFDQAVAWSTDGIVGPRRFLERVWRMQEKVVPKAPYDPALESLINETIKKVSDDIESMQFKDRKSTRLNSSHLVISYAVFCLKK